MIREMRGFCVRVCATNLLFRPRISHNPFGWKSVQSHKSPGSSFLQGDVCNRPWVRRNVNFLEARKKMNKGFFGYSCRVQSLALSLSPDIKQDCQLHMRCSRFLESITYWDPGSNARPSLPVGTMTSDRAGQIVSYN